MIRICHLADVHLGYRKYSKLTKTGLNQREADVSIAFREAVDRITSLKPDTTIIAGDLFHTVRPSNAVVTFAFRELRRLAAASPVVLVGGNHETPKRSDSGCILRLFSEIPGVFVCDLRAERFLIKEKELSVFAIPHAALCDIDRIKPRADDACGCNVLAAHGQIQERWISDFGGVELPLQSLSPHEWSYIALGHVHVPRQVSLNCWYSGSTEHTANNIWAERAEGKGFLEVTMQRGQASPKVTIHTLTSPREVHLLERISGAATRPEDLTRNIDEALAGIPGGIEGKIVRLEVFDAPREVIRQVDHRMIRKYRAAALHLSLEFRAPESDPTSSFVPAKRVRLEDALHSFCKERLPDEKTRTSIQQMYSSYFRKLETENEASPARA